MKKGRGVMPQPSTLFLGSLGFLENRRFLYLTGYVHRRPANGSVSADVKVVEVVTEGEAAVVVEVVIESEAIVVAEVVIESEAIVIVVVVRHGWGYGNRQHYRHRCN